ncbi:MAG: B12-binding domain-containing radical SAM protein [Chloroflexi bacterium]|nr:B12-binding domain-containing radical SAM protein [Chloroflexota bacterium]
MIKTTLIYPGIAGKGFNCVGKGMDGGWISHGLCSIAAATKAQGFPVDLIDLRAMRDWGHVRAELIARAPDVIGITMMSVDYNPVMDCLRIIREVLPQAITVVGGPHPAIMPDDVLRHSEIDYAVIGEGEITFPNLLKEINEGRRPAKRQLLSIHPNLDALPFADRDLFLDEWRKFGYDLESPEVPFIEELPGPFATIIAGRGCRYNCNYCVPAERYIFGKGVHRRSVDSVLQELHYLRRRFHIRTFMFHDDCLTEDRRWVTEFCQRYRAEGFDMEFCCQSRADVIVHNQDMVALMAEAGLRAYFIGFESGSDRVLRFIRKGTTRARNLEAAKICRRHGIVVWANYMLGLPTETETEIKETISMLKEMDPDYYSPAFFTPHPGTDLYDYVLDNDLSLIENYDQYKRNPTEAKIKGHDPKFMEWALAESQRRTFKNAARRKLRKLWARYGSPKKIATKVRNRVRRHIPAPVAAAMRLR